MWRHGEDTVGEIDVAVIELERVALPKATAYHAFTLKHLSTRRTRSRSAARC